jgi:3-methyl-2-oxobutanoate hydroxymethyltransferase
MSSTQLDEPESPARAEAVRTGDDRARKVTFQTLGEKKRHHEPITALTAYDYPTARLVDESGIDLILVGDSLGMVVLGYDSTLPVTLDEMLHHVKAVRRGTRRALLVADMPFGSYEADLTEGVRNALRLIKEGGAEAVKIEGGSARIELTRRLTDAQIPVVAHLGLTPQAVHRMGGYKVQARTLSAAEALLADALALEAAGAMAVVVEGVPREVAERVTASLEAPVIGIGAGPGCDGQILVIHDVLGLSFGPPSKFARRYADAGAVVREAVGEFARQVRVGTFPADAESYHLDAATRAAFVEVTPDPG